MNKPHLSIVEPTTGGLSVVPPPAVMSAEQIRELRAIGDRFGLLLIDAPIDYRDVPLNAAHASCIEEAAAELKRQGFLLLPAMLESVARRWENAAPAAPQPSCSCGGSGICLMCTLAALEADA